MNLEDIRYDSLDAIKAIEQLPEITIDNGIKGYSKWFAKEKGYPISAIHIFCEKELPTIRIPEGSLSCSCSFMENSLEFIYNSVQYRFIGKKEIKNKK
jgi:hypothetical protein